LQTELAEEKSQSLHSQKLRHEKKVVFLNVIKKFCMQARNILTNSSLARPDPKRPARLCTIMSKVLF